MRHGVTTGEDLRHTCDVIAKTLNDTHLSKLLGEVCAIETKSGRSRSSIVGGAGVCGISYEHYKLMLGHHKIFEHHEAFEKAFGIRMRASQYSYFAYNPTASLIFAAAWFHCYVDKTPQDAKARAKLFNRFWRTIDVNRYLSIANQ